MGLGEHTYEVTHDWPQLPDDLKFGNTHGIVADSQGCLIIAHTVHSTSKSKDAIAIFDADGKFVKSWGADMRGGAHGLTIRLNTSRVKVNLARQIILHQLVGDGVTLRFINMRD